MHRLLSFGILLFLSTLVYTPATAQPSDVRALAREIARQEAASRTAVTRWQADTRTPPRIMDAEGGVVELMYVENGRPLFLRTHNRAAAEAVGTAQLYADAPLGLSLSGEGMQIGVWDAGSVRASHQEVRGRVRLQDNGEPHTHATHVGGTLAAGGVRPEARGMAYAAILKSYDWNQDGSEMLAEAERGLLLSNHSYGPVAGWHYGDLEGTGQKWYWLGDPSVSETEDYTFGRYDQEAEQFDAIAHAMPYYLPVLAAGNDRTDAGPSAGGYRALDGRGNWQTLSVASHPRPADGGTDGYDAIAGAATGKNVLSVGATRLASGTPTPSSFSSFGPTDDGRIKPDLAGIGVRVFSALSEDDEAYGYSSGTSMASPNVAGSLLLLQEHHINRTGVPMRAASLKGLALHTARDLGPTGPDYATGWGLLDAATAAAQIDAATKQRLALFETTLDPADAFVREIRVDHPGPLRLTLSWTDPASQPRSAFGADALNDRTPHLINDLDLRLIAADGTEYLPFVLDPERPTRTALRADNRVDPIEQIYVPEAAVGTYTLTISHKGELWGFAPQPFTLLVSGATDAQRPVEVPSLSAAASVDGVALRWATTFEQSAGTFRIERAPLLDVPGVAGKLGAPVTVGTVAAVGFGAGADTGQDYAFTDVPPSAGPYRYRLVFESAEGPFLAAETDVEVPAPVHFAVLSNYPNPFAAQTTLVLDLPVSNAVHIAVFDALGRRVAVVHDAQMPAGRHRFPLDASGWSAGLYFARVVTPDGVQTHRLIVAR